MSKRIWSVILTLCLLTGLAPPWAGAAVVQSGTCGDNLTWTFDDNGTLTISGSGPMADYNSVDNVPWYANIPWYAFRENIIAIVIENGVTTIGDRAFIDCSALTSVMIPNSVTAIGNWAFASCSGLTSITIPDSVTEIGYRAFGGCSGLTSITIPDSVTAIGGGAFNTCSGLTSVTIPNSLTEIVETAFYGCNGLTSVTIPNSITSIDESAFAWCEALKDVYYNGTQAQWRAITIEDDDPILNATIHCTDGVLNGNDEFSDVGYEILIPMPDTFRTEENEEEKGKIELVSTGPYQEFRNLYVDGMLQVQGVDYVARPYDLSDVRASDGTYIAGLKPLSIGQHTISLEFEHTDSQGNVSAQWASQTVIIALYHSDVTPDDGSGSYLVEFDENGGGGFMNSVSVSGPAYTLPQNAFTAPYGMRFRTWRVEYDDGERVEYAPNTSVPLRSDLTVTALWEPDPSPLAQGYCGGENDGTNLSWTLSRDWNLTISGTGGMASYDADNRAPWYGYHTNIQTATLESGVSTIGSNAFTYCAALEEVTLPDTLVTIEDGAFLNCSALDSLTLPSGLRTLGNRAFYGCESLASVTLPGGVADTGDYTFEHCVSLRNVTFPVGLTRVGYYAFHDCALTSAILPDGLRTLDIGAFSECDRLRNVSFPATLTSIRERVFEGCAALRWESRDARYAGTVEQFGAVAQTLGADNDPLKAQVVHCSDGDYDWTPPDPYRILEEILDMDEFRDQTWHLAGPLSDFRTLTIDDTLLTKVDVLSRNGRDYTAEEGSTKLNIPAETFQTFDRGSHAIEAGFSDSLGGEQNRKQIYTVLPPRGTARIDISDMMGVAGVENVSYSGYFRSQPILEDGLFRFRVISGEVPPGLTLRDGGYFTGVAQTAGVYSLTVGLQVKRDGVWPADYEDAVSVAIIIEAGTKAKVETASDTGYELIKTIPDQVVETEMDPERFELVSQGPYDEFYELYVDGNLIPREDYTVRPYDLNSGRPILMDGGAITGTYLASSKIKLSTGLHPINLTFQHKDPLGNTEIKKSTQTVNITKKSVPVQTVTPTYSGGSGGGGSSSSSSTVYYTISKVIVGHGTVTLSGDSAKPGAQVTVNVVPDAGSQIKAVTVIGSNKKEVAMKGSNGNYTFIMPTRRVTVNASFASLTHPASVAETLHGAVSLSSLTAAPGDTVTVSTTPDKGYLLLNVAVRGADGATIPVRAIGNGSYTFSMPSGAVTARADFTPKRLGTFVDILGPYWFFDDAEWAYNRGVLRGVTNEYWEPETKISGVTAVVTLARLDGANLSLYDTGAADGLDNSKWYVSAVRWARANGICDPYRQFDEYEPLSRGEYAVMLRSFLRYRGLNVSGGDELSYSDAWKLTETQRQAFQFLQFAGVFYGYEDGSIRPDTNLNRAQLASLLHRLSQYIIRAETRAV